MVLQILLQKQMQEKGGGMIKTKRETSRLLHSCHRNKRAEELILSHSEVCLIFLLIDSQINYLNCIN